MKNYMYSDLITALELLFDNRSLATYYALKLNDEKISSGCPVDCADNIVNIRTDIFKEIENLTLDEKQISYLNVLLCWCYRAHKKLEERYQCEQY